MLETLLYKINSGKNSKLKYYILSIYRMFFPKYLLRPFLHNKLEKIRRREDYEYLMSRANYYCRIETESSEKYNNEQWLHASIEIGKQPMTGQKVFYYDAMKYARWFSDTYRWILLPGDIYRDEPLPCIAKSRLLQTKNTNITLLNMDYVRHFIFIKDRIPFSQKKDKVIFRGGISRRNSQRLYFVKNFFNHPLFDIKVRDKIYPEWWGEKISIQAHLHCKFIMTLEGNDVASNLKWVMSSNSIAVMPKPTCETWFMEGTLIPNYHYIEVKDDFSDLEERILYYIEHTDEAEAIVKHAHEYVEVFKNKEREDAIALLTLDKYFKLVNRPLH